MKNYSWAFCLMLVCALFPSAYAEGGILVAHVTNVEGQALPGIILSPRGDGSISPPTDRAGRTRIKLAVGTLPGKWVTLQVVGRQGVSNRWVFISPWDARVLVPPFDNESDNIVSIVLAKRSDKVLLENGSAVASITKSILNEIASRPVERRVTEEDRKIVLNEQAQKYGLGPEQIDQAIREWGEKSKDPFEKGLAALYAREYNDATAKLSESLRLRKEKFNTSLEKVVESAKFLGQCFLEQGRFREAAEILQQATDLRPDDIELLNDFGAALVSSADYAKAELVLQRAVAIGEESPISGRYKQVDALNTLGALYIAQGKFSEAESVINRAKVIIEKRADDGPPPAVLVATVLNSVAIVDFLLNRGQNAERDYDEALGILKKENGENNPDVALTLINKASLYTDTGRYTEAEGFLKQAIAIFDVLHTPTHPYLAAALFRLAFMYEAQHNYSESDPVFMKALAIREAALGLQHPDVAEALIGVANVYIRRGEYGAAESSVRRAIKIWETAIGKQYYALASAYNVLANVYANQGKRSEAEPLFRQSVQVAENTFGAEHFVVAAYLNDEAVNYYKQGKYGEAKPLYLRALAILEKRDGSGPPYPATVICLGNVGKLYTKQGEYEVAEQYFKRAISIGEKVLASSQVDFINILEGYAELLRKENRGPEAENIDRRIKDINTKSKQ